MDTVLDLFHPHLRDYFRESVGRPTEVQRLAWPRIAAGEHVLVTAPTGSGKTLTAFLWAIDRLLRGVWPPGQVRALYVSPLKALNTDIRRNLEVPLAAISKRLREAGEDVPAIRVMTRSGDTPPGERRRMLRQPPEILITTPESLNILLTSQSGRTLLTGLATVILDEIHAVASTKRGTHLVTAVERLVPLSGEFQRIALSATVRPLRTVAELIGGYVLEETEGGYGYRKRPVSIVRSTAAKRYDVRVRSPVRSRQAAAPPAEGTSGEDPRWELMGRDFKSVIRENRATLFFANSRRMTERVTRLVNQDEDEDLAYSHHGSLSREVRSVVEERLKRGELPAIVATNSLELGIDVGTLDEVVLIQTPHTISSAIQRVGRAGHGVGEVSRGRIYPTFGRDFLNAAVVARAIEEQDIEELRPIMAPLDVLAQVILSMVAAEDWDVERLFAVLRTSYPYRHLPRRQLDLVLEMLAGRYADTRIRELRPRITLDRVTGTVRARAGVARLLYMSGGTIADRGYFTIRLDESMTRIGELDEEFVWERSLGDNFTLGAQSWQIRRITHNDVLVVPGRGRSAMAPFWRADARDRDFHFSEKVALFLQRAEDHLDDEAFAEKLTTDYHMEPAAAQELLDFLRLQKAATGVLPHRHRLLVEHVSPPPEERGAGRRRLILHTFWGGRVNRPFAMALAAAWEERHGELLEVIQDDDAILLMLPRPTSADEIFQLVPPDDVEELLRTRLERTGFFGSRFRINASTALLLPRAGFRQRTPLWLNRRRSKKLMESVAGYGDFPILVETWRTCLRDDLDLETLKRLLGEVQEERIAVHEVRTDAPSPFTSELGWQLTNQYMYEDDTPEGGARSGVRPDLLKELVFASHLRPRLDEALVERFRRKVQRTSPGYAPRDGEELLAWIDERVLIPPGEWRELIDAAAEEAETTEGDLFAAIRDRVVRVRLPGAGEDAVVALDRLVRTVAAVYDLDELKLSALDGPGSPAEAALDALAKLRALSPSGDQGGGTLPRLDRDEEADPLADLVGEWLRFQGPVVPERLEALFGLGDVKLRDVLETLAESRCVVLDELTREAPGTEVCDAENLEVLLRWLRVAKRPSFTALPADHLPLFLAVQQGLARRGDGLEGLQEGLEKLFGYPAPASAWETEILPARLDPYYPSWLDSLMQESDLTWLGCGNERLTFAFPMDLELFEDDGDDGELGELFPQGHGRFTLGELADRSGRSTARLTEELWRLAWTGRVTNDTFLAVRKGIESKWKPQEVKLPQRRGRRSRRAAQGRWQASRPFQGHWFALEREAAARDALDEEELVKDRVRQLLGRYGVLFRELLARELPSHRWPRIFRTLRLMELGGEVLTGRFFEGVRGLQFISQAAFRELRRGLPEDAIFWLNAADPASLCGIDVEGLKESLPQRQATTHLVFHGRRLVVVSRRRGRELDVRVGADHPHLADYLAVLKVLVAREVEPLKSVDVEVINGEPAPRSPYAAAFEDVFHAVREPSKLKLWKRYSA